MTIIALNREDLLRELRGSFDVKTSNMLLGVLERVAEKTAEASTPREDFTELKQTVQRIADLQVIGQQRMDQLTGRMDQLAVRMDQLTERIDQLTLRLEKLEKIVEDLVRTVKLMNDRIGRMDGELLELKYSRRAGAYLNRILRRAEEIFIKDEFLDELESKLSEKEIDDLALSDLIMRGKPRRQAAIDELYALFEVSTTIDTHDVARASRRAQLLRRAGYATIAIAAGERSTEDVVPLAQQLGVVLMFGGALTNYDESLSPYLSTN